MIDASDENGASLIFNIYENAIFEMENPLELITNTNPGSFKSIWDINIKGGSEMIS